MDNKKTLESDFCVIGAGPEGLSFAAGVAQMGASVIVLNAEKSGSDSFSNGCASSKGIVAASKILDTALKNDLGIPVSDKKIDFQTIQKNVHDALETPNNSVELLESLGIQIILEEGKFKNAYSVETDQHIVKAKRFVIATGSSPFMPEIEGLSGIPYYTNENIFDLKELPKDLVIIGGGPVALELSQTFSKLGSHVTVLEDHRAFSKNEPAFTEKLKDTLKSNGVSIDKHVHIDKCIKNGKKISITYQMESGKTKQILASHILISTQNKPNITNLNLDAAQVKFNEKGIEISRLFQTSNKKIYAIGDCADGYCLKYTLGYEVAVNTHNTMCGFRTKTETKVVPWIVYKDVALAHVGYSEEKLIKDGVKYKVLYLDASKGNVVVSEEKTGDMFKVLVSPNGYILGVTVINSKANELIYPWIIGIRNDLKVDVVVRSIATYPVLNSFNTYVEDFFYSNKVLSS